MERHPVGIVTAIVGYLVFACPVAAISVSAMWTSSTGHPNVVAAIVIGSQVFMWPLVVIAGLPGFVLTAVLARRWTSFDRFWFYTLAGAANGPVGFMLLAGLFGRLSQFPQGFDENFIVPGGVAGAAYWCGVRLLDHASQGQASRPRKHGTRGSLLSFGTFATIVVILSAGLWVGYRSSLRSHHLSLVPEPMGIETILYVEEDTSGFGLGERETGFLVYRMPGNVSAALKGPAPLNYLEQLPYRSEKGWRGHFSDWKQTPISGPIGEGGLGEQPQVSSRIGDYLDRYGLGVRIDASWENLANRAIESPGNFYA